MQHWLKGISPASAPFSQSFEDLLRTNSGKKSSQKPKSQAVEQHAEEAMPEVSYTDPRANAAAEPSIEPLQDSAQSLQVLICFAHCILTH